MQVWCNGQYVGDFPSATGQVLDFKIFGTWHKFTRARHSHRTIVDADHQDEQVELFVEEMRVPVYAEWSKPVRYDRENEIMVEAYWDVLEVSLETYEQIFDHSGFKPVV